MKIILNCLLYAAQWLHLRMGGEIYVARDYVVLIKPKGRHWCAIEPEVEARLKAREAAKTANNNARDEICENIALTCVQDGLNCRGDESTCRFTSSQTSPVA